VETDLVAQIHQAFPGQDKVAVSPVGLAQDQEAERKSPDSVHRLLPEMAAQVHPARHRLSVQQFPRPQKYLTSLPGKLRSYLYA